ncbi:hypothetical protein HK101_007707 [Irineochytrium annulatum]|nr:hypothetical protein HK101_007707 [Irineochytrium annulatum]
MTWIFDSAAKAVTESMKALEAHLERLNRVKEHAAILPVNPKLLKDVENRNQMEMFLRVLDDAAQMKSTSLVSVEMDRPSERIRVVSSSTDGLIETAKKVKDIVAFFINENRPKPGIKLSADFTDDLNRAGEDMKKIYRLFDRGAMLVQIVNAVRQGRLQELVLHALLHRNLDSAQVDIVENQAKFNKVSTSVNNTFASNIEVNEADTAEDAHSIFNIAAPPGETGVSAAASRVSRAYVVDSKLHLMTDPSIMPPQAARITVSPTVRTGILDSELDTAADPVDVPAQTVQAEPVLMTNYVAASRSTPPTFAEETPAAKTRELPKEKFSDVLMGLCKMAMKEDTKVFSLSQDLCEAMDADQELSAEVLRVLMFSTKAKDDDDFIKLESWQAKVLMPLAEKAYVKRANKSKGFEFTLDEFDVNLARKSSASELIVAFENNFEPEPSDTHVALSRLSPNSQPPTDIPPQFMPRLQPQYPSGFPVMPFMHIGQGNYMRQPMMMPADNPMNYAQGGGMPVMMIPGAWRMWPQEGIYTAGAKFSSGGW